MNRASDFFFKNRSAILLMIAETFAGWAFAVRHLTAFASRGIDQPLLLSFLFICAFFLGTAVFYLLGRAAAGLAGKFCLPREFVLSKLVATLAPVLILLLDFIQEKFILRNISPTLLLLAAAGIMYLNAVFYFKLLRIRPLPQQHSNLQTEQKPAQQRRTLLAVFLTSFGIYSFILLSGILPPLPFAGDEPHYLLIAKSMVLDRDIDLYNNYLQKDYWEFYPGEISWHAYPGKDGPKHLYSKHFPGLSLLLTPACWCGDRLGKSLKIPGINNPNARNIHVLLARETMVLLTSLLVAFFFLMVWEITQTRRTAFYSWIFFAFTPPLLFYSRLLYSEIPVALILLLVLRQALFKGSVSNQSLFWSGLGIAIIPWFGIKYVILAAVIFVIYIHGQWQNLIKRQWNFFFFLGPFLISIILFLAFLWRIYGMISPFAVYFGTAAAKVMPFQPNAIYGQVNFASRALAYFLDQRMGLFIHSPLYILFIPGIVLMLRKYKQAGLASLTLAASYWVFCTYTQSQGGYVPPERVLLPVGFILALFVSATLSWAKNRSVLPLLRILAVIAILMSLLAVLQPQLFFHKGLSDDSWDMDTRSQVLMRLSNLGVDFTQLVPNLTFRPGFSWLILLVWLALITGISLAVLKNEKNGVPPGIRLGGNIFWTILLSFLLAAYYYFDVRLDDQNQLTVPGGTVYFQDGNSFGPELGGFWTRGNCRTELVLKTSTPVKKLRLEMTSRGPIRASVQIGSQLVENKLPTQAQFATAIIIPIPGGTPWKGNILYLIRLEVSGGFVPNKIEAANSDSRFLGLFVRLLPAF